jgi:hypothetical protein
LFLVTTAAAMMLAMMLALLRYMGIFGAVVSFLSAFLFTVVALPWLIPWQTARQCKVFDFVWGVVMPVVCLVFLTLAALVHRIEEFFFAGPLLTLYSVAMLTALVAGKSARRIAPFLAGLLAGPHLLAAANDCPRPPGNFLYVLLRRGAARLLSSFRKHRLSAADASDDAPQPGGPPRGDSGCCSRACWFRWSSRWLLARC